VPVVVAVAGDGHGTRNEQLPGAVLQTFWPVFHRAVQFLSGMEKDDKLIWEYA
jgi:hypothetical protein